MVLGLDGSHLPLAPATLRLCPTQGDCVHWLRRVAAGVLGPKEQGTGPGRQRSSQNLSQPPVRGTHG